MEKEKKNQHKVLKNKAENYTIKKKQPQHKSKILINHWMDTSAVYKPVKA